MTTATNCEQKRSHFLSDTSPSLIHQRIFLSQEIAEISDIILFSHRVVYSRNARKSVKQESLPQIDHLFSYFYSSIATCFPSHRNFHPNVPQKTTATLTKKTTEIQCLLPSWI
jgi:hypothetical protein